MKYSQISLLILLSITSSSSFAAGKGSGSLKDLMFPAINFAVLFGFIIYKYKNVISKNYSEESIRIQNLISDAFEADKQASLKLDSLNAQLQNIDKLKNELKDRAAEKLNQQVDAINLESKSKLKKLEDDKLSRFEQEKSILVNQSNSKILDMVIDDAKNIVGSDKVRKQTTEEKLLASIN